MNRKRADESETHEGLDPALVAWLVDVTGTDDLSIERRTGGASRAGYAVDARARRRHDASSCGCGPTRGSVRSRRTLYSLRREAAVYRALGDTPMRVAELVAVHPDEPAFLMRRVRGREPVRADRRRRRAARRSRASSSTSSSTLHRLDPTALDLPELGAARRDLRPRARRDRRVGHAVRHRRWRRARHLARVVVVAGPRARRRRLAGRARAGRHRAGQLHVRRRPAHRRSPTGSSRTGATSTTTSRGSWCATPSSGSPSSTRGCADYEQASGFTDRPGPPPLLPRARAVPRHHRHPRRAADPRPHGARSRGS